MKRLSSNKRKMDMQSNSQNKPVVHYINLGVPIQVGERAVVQPVDHPSSEVSNKHPVLTTVVRAFDEVTGIFETNNHIYHPETVQS